MRMKFLGINRVIFYAVVCVASFALLRYLFEPRDLIVLLNGLLAGSLVAIAVAYHELIYYAARGIGAYDRVRQMTLGFALCWAAIALGVATSIYIRSFDMPATAFTVTAFARWLAIWAAILQVTAPDFGLGIFHGRDRKVLTASIGLGALSAVAVILLQEAR